MSRESDSDNHANQMNSNNDAYWESRGDEERPDDWEEQVAEEEGRHGERQSPGSKH